MDVRRVLLAAALALLAPSLVAQVRLVDDFEHGLDHWEVYGTNSAFVVDSRDPKHGRVLVLRPQGDVYVLAKDSNRWGSLRIEGDVLFPTNGDSYLGVLYNFQKRGRRTNFGNIYIKGNDNNLIVNPHRDFNVGRTLYEEYRTPLTGDSSIAPGAWQRFRAEIMGNVIHFYVGDVTAPQLIFPFLELSSGSVGVQPRSVGDNVWIDNIRITSIDKLSYEGPDNSARTYAVGSLLTDWEVYGPLARTNDDVARRAKAHPWKNFSVDGRGAVITSRVVDYHGEKTVAYLRTVYQNKDAVPKFLHISSVDDIALWLNGRFYWFIPRKNAAWHDFWKNESHNGQRIPLDLISGTNELVFRVRGGVYASGGFFARVEP